MRTIYRQYDCDEDGHKWVYCGTDGAGCAHFYCSICGAASE